VSLPLLEQVLAKPSEEGRRQLLEAHSDELPALLPQWSRSAFEASKAGDREPALAIQELLPAIFTAAGLTEHVWSVAESLCYHGPVKILHGVLQSYHSPLGDL
jgi:hypothetical protein